MARSGGKKFDDDDTAWFALRVIPQKEYAVARMVERHGDVWAYVPTSTVWRRRTSYTKSGTEYAKPEMPGCIFIRLAGEPEWFFLLRNHLILGPIGRNGEPWRFRPRELFSYFSRTPNGSLVLTRGEPPQVSVQGRLLRAPTTQVRFISKRKKDDDPVIEPTKKENAILGGLAVVPQPMLAAA